MEYIKIPIICADAILALGEAECGRLLMQIILAKNRHASTGTCDAAFYRAVGRIIPAR